MLGCTIDRGNSLALPTLSRPIKMGKGRQRQTKIGVWLARLLVCRKTNVGRLHIGKSIKEKSVELPQCTVTNGKCFRKVTRQSLD